MPKQLIESQFLALEEPREGIVIDANWLSEKAVTTIRSTLGK
jgi:gluconate kinase